ncbi:LiaI-LiaF-like domain-containing protein [Salinibacillus xinjiangensis]|uniref:LiaI-LiaF-like transmembrane region domain-containing protein n=1 Tax=Salinibacillus xinjiangensis TaxID=1229268 RepID=A0A6G1XB43_9BACI|nr:DUF5668 domain-containing protein [Salinibacillus xinjiangensis]MRG88204.1 hypothetical protein [Salinibacillus xinjiangensis]
MGKQHIFISTFLIGMGLYFLLQDYSIPLLANFHSWPTIIIILGISFLLQSGLGKAKDSMFPGILLLGLGIHFHLLMYYTFWFNHWSVYLLIISLAFILKSAKGQRGLGFILLAISIISILLYSKPSWLHNFKPSFIDGLPLLPIILIGLGIYMLFNKK